MSESPLPAINVASMDARQADLPGIPRGSSLHEILTAYGLAPTEAPEGHRRYRHELMCGALRAVAEVWIKPDGEVSSFRIWSLKPRKARTKAAARSV